MPTEESPPTPAKPLWTPYPQPPEEAAPIVEHRTHTRLLREINTQLHHMGEQLDTRFYHLDQRLELRVRQATQQIQEGHQALAAMERRISWLTLWLVLIAGLMIASAGGFGWLTRLTGPGILP